MDSSTAIIQSLNQSITHLLFFLFHHSQFCCPSSNAQQQRSAATLEPRPRSTSSCFFQQQDKLHLELAVCHSTLRGVRSSQAFHLHTKPPPVHLVAVTRFGLHLSSFNLDRLVSDLAPLGPLCAASALRLERDSPTRLLALVHPPKSALIHRLTVTTGHCSARFRTLSEIVLRSLDIQPRSVSHLHIRRLSIHASRLWPALQQP